MSENRSSRPKGQNDPGWNDPPKMEFNSVQQSGKGTRLNLNKRVAFPLQGTSASKSTAKPTAIVHPSHLPPMTMPPIAIVPPMARSPPSGGTNSCTTDEAVNSNESRLESDERTEINLPDSERQFCLDTFVGCIPRIAGGINIRPDEVQRRINLMNQMWLSGTMAPSVQRKLLNIAKALIESNFSEAIETHRTLVVNHSNVCAAWGAALRQIILTIQSTSSSDMTTEQQQSGTPNIAGEARITESDRSEPENHSSSVQHL